MFASLPACLRSYGLQADVRTLLLLTKAVERDLVKTLGDIYNVLKGIVVKNPRDMGPYTRAYYIYFLNIDIENGESLNDAVLRSETFRTWKEDNLDRFGDDLTSEDFVHRFLDDVHLTSYDIKKIIDGKALWEKDNPDLEDQESDSEDFAQRKRPLDKMADYSDLSLEELLERMQKVLDQQRSRHSGGSHWIGTGGISPYGHGGAAKDGIRMGGTGGGRMARKVLNDHNFFPVDLDKTLNDNNIDAALSSLKGVFEETSRVRLDVKGTIKKGLRRGGLFIPELSHETDKKLQVILLIDNGGYSMMPYVRSVQALFRKMKTRFAHDLETYYFHNTIYDRVYQDPQRRKGESIDKLLVKNPSYKIFVIGDAAMAPWELNRMSLNVYKKLTSHFEKMVWLNPEPEKYWRHTFSIQVIKELVPMFHLSPSGIEKAITHLNRIK